MGASGHGCSTFRGGPTGCSPRRCTTRSSGHASSGSSTPSPRLKDDADIEAHLRDEFEGADVPTWFGAGLGIAEWVPGGSHLSAAVARRTIDRMAQQFIIGTDPAETAEACAALWRRHTAATVDVLGEHTHSEAEADRYAERLRSLVVALADGSESWPVDDLLEADDIGRVPKASVSVKVTALAPSFTMLTSEQGIEQATRRLLPVLEIASGEERLGLVRHGELRGEGAHPRPVPQAPRTAGDEPAARAGSWSRPTYAIPRQDLESLASWAAGRAMPPGVRLVKGSYWDTETVEAEAESWPAPVFERKAETDANFERLVRILHSHHGTLRAAFGSHNLRSLAVVMTEARRLEDPRQRLRDPAALRDGRARPRRDAAPRCPAPRLLPDGRARSRNGLPGEAASREHLQRELRAPPFRRRRGLDELCLLRTSTGSPDRSHSPSRPATDPAAPAPYRPEPLAEWRRPEVKDADGGRDRGRVRAPTRAGWRP